MPPEVQFSPEPKPARGLAQFAAAQQAEALNDVHVFNLGQVGDIFMPEQKKSYIGEAVSFVVTKTGLAEPGSQAEKDWVYYTSALTKAVPLFMKGKTAVVATGVLFGMDQAKPTDDWGAQSIDFLGGTTKGVALKGLFALAGSKQLALSPLEKGLYIGTGSRAIDTLTNRYSYMNRQGDASLNALGQNFHHAVFNRDALVVDLLLFGAAGTSHFGINRYTGKLLERNPFANNVTTGATFGLFSGGLEEVEMQRKNGGVHDYMAILKRSLMRMVVDGVAAVPGGVQARNAAIREAAAQREALAATTLPKLPEVVQVTQVPKATPAVALKEISPVAGPPEARGIVEPVAQAPKVEPLTSTPAEGFARLSQQIVEPTTRVETFPGKDPNHARPFHAVEKPAVVYKAVDASGKVVAEVIVEQQYANALNEVRQLRLEISAAKTPAEKAAAVQRLNEKGMSDRMLPEDVLHHLQQIPGRPFTRVKLHNGDNPFDHVPNVKQYGIADATVTGKGELTIFAGMSSNPAKAAVTHEGFLHEWTHELRTSLPEHARLYDSVASREPSNVRDYAAKSPEESFAVNLAEGILHPNPETALAFARSAPVKNLVLARAAIAGVEKTPLVERTTAEQSILDRARAIEADLLPRALDVLRMSTQYPTDTVFDIAGRETGNLILTAQTMVSLANRNVNDAFIRSLMGLDHFTAADLSGNPGVTNVSASALSSWPRLQRVQAPGTGITDTGVNRLTGLPLKELGLARTGIGDAALTEGQPLLSLERANFSNTRMGDAGIRKLEAATGLRWLMLEGTPITDAAIPSLAKLKLLTDLNVHRTQMTPEGVRRLRALLPGTKITY